MKKGAPGWLRYVGDYTTQLCGIVINHCKDPYWTSSAMESRFFFVAQMKFRFTSDFPTGIQWFSSAMFILTHQYVGGQKLSLSSPVITWRVPEKMFEQILPTYNHGQEGFSAFLFYFRHFRM